MSSCFPFLHYGFVVQIEKGEIEAQLSASGTVTFSDDTNTSIKFTQKDVDKVLKEAEEQGVLLKRLELEMARSREYLSKVRHFFLHLFPLL